MLKDFAPFINRKKLFLQIKNLIEFVDNTMLLQNGILKDSKGKDLPRVEVKIHDTLLLSSFLHNRSITMIYQENKKVAPLSYAQLGTLFANIARQLLANEKEVHELSTRFAFLQNNFDEVVKREVESSVSSKERSIRARERKIASVEALGNRETIEKVPCNRAMSTAFISMIIGFLAAYFTWRVMQ